MKELTIEQKAKYYDEAFERARKFKNGEIEHELEIGENIMEYIFPELKEDEDERIRKELLAFIENWKNPNNLGRPQDYPMFTKNEEQCDKYIAWLEKQGEQKDIANKEYWRGYREGKQVILDKYSELEKQGEQWPTDKEEPTDYNSIDPGFAKPIDKLEPRFYEGDWAVINGIVLKIQEVRNDLYEATLQNGEVRIYDTCVIDNDAHLWTIKDVKDGDILTRENRPFIYNGKVNPPSIGGYCGIDIDYNFKINKEQAGCGIWTGFDTNIYPATKEQSNFLFSKMHESGYEWDSVNFRVEEINYSD